VMDTTFALLSLVQEADPLGARLPLWAVAPFVLLLLSIAVLPLVAGHWWHKNRNQALVAALLATPFAIWLFTTHGADSVGAFKHAVTDYVSFIMLLAALYVISGGIYMRGSLAGTPLSNTTLLAIGAVLANLIGTTGASVVLVRPLLRANKKRQDKTHIFVFFIFIVSNCGGLLTPFADPPLYLGYLKGVPFDWTLRLWREWALVVTALLFVFIALDSFVFGREEKRRRGSQLEAVMAHERVGLEGTLNIVFLLGVIAVIFANGRGLGTGGGKWPFGVQEGLMLGLMLLSWKTTKRALHEKNEFTFDPIIEVAILFAGIFVTMIAPLEILNARGADLGLQQPWQYFWATGGLSAFLDNAPTYLTFTAVASGQAGISVDHPKYLAEYLASGQGGRILEAISCGAVMMGAMTYIGNGPNFMVKAIAQHNGVKMPSFFGFLVWSLVVLVPIFVLVTFVFFR
jgi:Na+/H+ antiporter NhaD/arsenite permease-like protein